MLLDLYRSKARVALHALPARKLRIHTLTLAIAAEAAAYASLSNWRLVLLVIIALLAVTVRVSELKQDLGEITGALAPQVRAQQWR